MKPQTIEEKVEWYAMLHGQNLNGRETEDELFEAGILAGIEETEEIMYSDGEVGEIVYNIVGELAKYHGVIIDGAKLNELFKQFKKEKGL
jgi:hypothetical protein